MANKLPLPSPADFYNSSDNTFDKNAFNNAWDSVFYSSDYPDGYDFTPLLNYPGNNISGLRPDKAYKMALSGNDISFSALGWVISDDYRYSLSGDDVSFTENFNTFLNTLSSNSNSTDFEFSINNIDLSVYFIGAGIIILALASIWASKRALGILK